VASTLTGLGRLPLPAVVDGEVRRSSDECTERALRLAGGLRSLGVQPGDVVAFDAPPGEPALLAYAACWALGATAAPLHHRLSAVERAALLDRLKPVAVLGPDLPDAAAADPVRADDDAVAVLLATSGSSGQPKLVRHTFGALAYKAGLMTGVHGLRPTDTVLMPAPMAHISGLLNGLLLPAAAGMTVVFLPRWDAGHALDLIAGHAVSFMIGPPTYFVQLMRAPAFAREDVCSLRLLSCGGAGVTERFCRSASAALGARVKRTYGSTEAPTVTTSYADDPVELGWTTDGRPVGDVELRVDRATGELSVRGRELFAGYTDAGPTAQALSADGWFRTGDRARVDGVWLTILGRLRDTIIRGGENVDPVEVETVCAAMPGVHQAVVVGYPDDVMGERVGLVVVADAPPGVEAVRRHCAEAGLASFKQPERVLALDEVPVLTVGKPDRAALRRLLA
jgi:cyclohexanecarboxylate-CoA ligase